jgi:diguanylate cyclase (GGDEF)-like protein
MLDCDWSSDVCSSDLLVARYGGEEFAVVLPETPLAGARKIAEDLRQGVASLGIPHASSPVAETVTISLGVASLVPPPGGQPHEMWALADQALYQAKSAGRNRLMVVQEQRPAPLGPTAGSATA